MLARRVGKRDQATTNIFIEGLRHATANQNLQITTDGFMPYRSAIDDTLADRVDFAVLIKSLSSVGCRGSSILPLKSSARRWSQLSAIPSLSVSAHPMWNAPISRCGPTSAASRA